MYKLICLVVLLSAFINCSNIASNNEKRAEVIRTAIELIKQGNVDSLKAIVDTSYFYKLHGKDGFEGTVKSTQRKIAVCEIPNSDRYKINDPIPQLTEYTLQFCRTAGDSLTDNSFDLVFTFMNKREPDLIVLIDLRDYSYRNKRNEPPPGL